MTFNMLVALFMSVLSGSLYAYTFVAENVNEPDKSCKFKTLPLLSEQGVLVKQIKITERNAVYQGNYKQYYPTHHCLSDFFFRLQPSYLKHLHTGQPSPFFPPIYIVLRSLLI